MTPFYLLFSPSRRPKINKFYPLILSYFSSIYPPILPLWDALKPLLFLPKTLTQNIVILVDLSKILPTFINKVSKILPT